MLKVLGKALEEMIHRKLAHALPGSEHVWRIEHIDVCEDDSAQIRVYYTAYSASPHPYTHSNSFTLAEFFMLALSERLT